MPELAVTPTVAAKAKTPASVIAVEQDCGDFPPYPFESEAKQPRRRKEAKQFLEVMALRMDLELDGADEEFKRPLEDFIMEHQLPITWYQKKISRELKLRGMFFYATMALLLLLPLGIYILSPRRGIELDAVEPLAAQITVLLTGLFAFHRGMAAWLDKRKVVGLFSRAMSALKQQLYELEQQWDKPDDRTRFREEFLEDIETRTIQARKILAEEEDEYFTTLSYPTFNLGQVLQTSASEATDLFDRFRNKATERQIALQQAEGTLRSKEALVREYEALVETQRAALANETDADNINSLREALIQNLEKLRQAELSLAIARAERDSFLPN